MLVSHLIFIDEKGRDGFPTNLHVFPSSHSNDVRWLICHDIRVLDVFVSVNERINTFIQ